MPVLEAEYLTVAEEHVELARTLAWKYFSKSPPEAGDIDELRAIANLALVQALARWPTYCAEKGYDHRNHDYLIAYLVMRINGALLDDARSHDHMARSRRGLAKTLEKFTVNGDARPAVLAEATGMDPKLIASVQAEAANKPCHMSDIPPGEDTDWSNGANAVTDEGADTEAEVTVRCMLYAVRSVLSSLRRPDQEIMALVYFYGMKLADAAEVVGIGLEEAKAVHTAAVLQVHNALLMQATA